MPEHEEPRTRQFCPYCDEEMLAPDGAGCQTCGITVFYCPQCRNPVPRDQHKCPECGAEIKGEQA